MGWRVVEGALRFAVTGIVYSGSRPSYLEAIRSALTDFYEGDGGGCEVKKCAGSANGKDLCTSTA
jgi:hypothetical protein